mmetsp:Transcript_63574/g.176272  ORF Transcript_63574/g.176272 Transcript_63574/m.176272 type:complete len:257 (-) Transcript_63574:865-1635(-)
MRGAPAAAPAHRGEGAHPDDHALALLEARGLLQALDHRLRGVEVRADDAAQERVPHRAAVQHMEVADRGLPHGAAQQRGQVLHVQRGEHVEGDALVDQELGDGRRRPQPAPAPDPAGDHVPWRQAIGGHGIHQLRGRGLPDEPHGLRPVPGPAPVGRLMVHLVWGQGAPEEQRHLEGHVRQQRPRRCSKPSIIKAGHLATAKEVYCSHRAIEVPDVEVDDAQDDDVQVHSEEAEYPHPDHHRVAREQAQQWCSPLH